MLGLTDDQMRGRFEAHPELRCEGRRLYFADAEASSIRVGLRVREVHQLVYLARLVAHLGYEEVHFRSADLWITTWSVWSAPVEAIGFKILEQFRRSFGENRSLDAAPGHHFRHDEFTESVCCLLQPMTVGWDAYYVPHWAYGDLDYFVFVSHDSFIRIEVRTSEMYDRAVEILKGHEWTPLLGAEG